MSNDSWSPYKLWLVPAIRLKIKCKEKGKDSERNFCSYFGFQRQFELLDISRELQYMQCNATNGDKYTTPALNRPIAAKFTTSAHYDGFILEDDQQP